MSKKVRDEKVVEIVLNYFRLDKLCPECNGPLEKQNRVRCKRCSLKRHIETQIDRIETATMSMRYDAGIKPHRLIAKRNGLNKTKSKRKNR
jgi:hypothetical protein